MFTPKRTEGDGGQGRVAAGGVFSPITVARIADTTGQIGNIKMLKTCILCGTSVNEDKQLIHLVAKHNVVVNGLSILPGAFVDNLCKHENVHTEKSTTASWGASAGDAVFTSHRCEDCGYEWTD